MEPGLLAQRLQEASSTWPSAKCPVACRGCFKTSFRYLDGYGKDGGFRLRQAIYGREIWSRCC